jgi:hypothetical protein
MPIHCGSATMSKLRQWALALELLTLERLFGEEIGLEVSILEVKMI